MVEIIKKRVNYTLIPRCQAGGALASVTSNAPLSVPTTESFLPPALRGSVVAEQSPPPRENVLTFFDHVEKDDLLTVKIGDTELNISGVTIPYNKGKIDSETVEHIVTAVVNEKIDNTELRNSSVSALVHYIGERRIGKIEEKGVIKEALRVGATETANTILDDTKKVVNIASQVHGVINESKLKHKLDTIGNNQELADQIIKNRNEAVLNHVQTTGDVIVSVLDAYEKAHKNKWKKDMPSKILTGTIEGVKDLENVATTITLE